MRLRLPALVLVAGALAITLLGTASANTRAPFPQGKLDLQSAMPLTAESVVTETSPASGSGSTGSGSPPRVGDNVFANAPQIGRFVGLVGRSETTISLHGQNLLAGWNDAEGFCTPAICTGTPLPIGLSGYGYSTDGGQTWTDGGAPPLLGTGIVTRGDPWMDNNGGQTWYYANLATNLTGASVGISVHRGHFEGGAFVWDDVQSFDSPHNTTLCTNPNPPGNQIPCDFYDKEALVAGKGPNKNDAYVSLTNFLGQKFIGPPPGCGDLATFGFGQIEVWRTHDGGATWQGPAIAGPEPADSVAACGDAGTLQQSSAPAIGPSGDVYVAWQYGPTFAADGSSGAGAAIKFAKSTDGGMTFSTPTTVANIDSSRANSPIGYNRSRVNDHPRIDVALTGATRGRIYVTYYSSASPVPSASFPGSQQTLVNIQTYLKYSDDGGATWSTPVEIGGALPSPLPTGVGAIKRWWPDVSVSPGGEVHVVYQEEQATQLTADPIDTECSRTTDGATRVGRYSSLVDTWWTYSKDGGASFSMPLKLSSGTSQWCTPLGNALSNIRPNMGDYLDAQAGTGLKVYGFWADGRDFGPYPQLGPGNFLFAGSAFAAGKS